MSFQPAHSQHGQLSRVPYLPGLDGMRALAVVAVMLYHANHTWLPGGFLGVEVFFVISGYLITLLLLGEEERTGFIDLKAFWKRRFRRLLPALLTMLTLLAIYMAVTRSRALGRTRGDFIAGFPFYGSNWYQIWVGQGYTATESFVPLRHLWSLAVEEQFYLIWPLVMIFLLRRRDRAGQARLGVIFIGISVAIAVVMGVLYAGGDIAGTCAPDQMNGYWKLFGRCISTNDFLYLSSFTRAGGILLGAGLAMLWRPVAVTRGPLRDLGGQLDAIAMLGLAALALLMWLLHVQQPGSEFGSRFDPWLFRGGLLLTGVATAAVIMAATHNGASAGRWLGNPLFNWIGTRSYGLYLYHWPIYQIIREQAGVLLSPLQFILAMAITVPLTEASYRFIETPVRQGRLGDVWHRARRDGRSMIGIAGVATLALFGGVSVALANNQCVGAVECANEAAAQTTPPEPTSTVAPPATGQVPAPSSSTTPAVVTTTTLPPPKPYAAFGESVMAGALAPLRTGGGLIDVKEGRGPNKLLEEVKLAKRRGQIGAKTPVAIQIGTNGTVTDAQFAAILAQLKTQRVVFLTVTAPNAPWIAGNNQRIRALPAKFKNVTLVDWEAQSKKVKMCKDKVHISCDPVAIRTYANLIFTAIGRKDLVK